MEQRAQFDVAIIGGGIVGLMTARALSRYRLRVVVLEQAQDLAEGASKANSGILYPGFHPRGGSLKGIACVRGNQMYDALCKELQLPMKRIGSLYVAFHPEGEEMLLEKYQKGLKNGVKGMELLSGEAARAREPLLSPRVTRALYAPSTAILSPFALLFAVAGHAMQNGVEIRLETTVQSLRPEQDGVLLQTETGWISSRYVVNAAGENAILLEGMLRPEDLEIRPRRGQYLLFDKGVGDRLHHVLYQAQEQDEGGTLVAPTIEGNLIAGPTSEDVPSYRHTETTAKGLLHVERVAKKLIPTLDLREVITQFAGVRTNIVNLDKEHKDFILRVSAPRVISALGIKNPGMTAAPYLAEEIVRLLAAEGLPLLERADYQAEYQPFRPFLQETKARQRVLYEADPRNAVVLCRCEGITEGDVLRVLDSPLPPTTWGGLKKRLRIGMGRCQGGFCTGRVLELMSRELGLAPGQLCKGAKGSSMVKGTVKG